ncbi:hypothetical protein [Micromonospora sp. NBC_01638]|uniref:hypothetical protein n=1 Tax=Micromonospora sp. NBC_01638 TaxID=2975982 RepID=UPI003868B140|nr:hypothetical protein OG811_10530 [Micromonospora sp. NBC_01638]
MVLILESRTHLDLGDLPNLLAAELGVMTVRLERAIRSLDGVARVHVNRWGDGSAHLHMWFLARPYGRLQLRGTFLSLWDSILPPISEAQWRENLALVAAWLAEFGGRPLAEPPRIQWQAPSSLLAQSAAVAAAAEAAAAEAVSVIEAAEEIPEPALDSTPDDDPTDGDTAPSVDPILVDTDPDAGSTSTVTDPAGRTIPSASITHVASGTSGTPPSAAPAPASAADAVGPSTNGPAVRRGPADEATEPAAQDSGTSGASTPKRGTPDISAAGAAPGATSHTNGPDEPDVRTTN